MRKNKAKSLRFVLHKIIVPVAVVTSSAAILSVSFWYHEKQLAKQLSNPNSKQLLAHQIQSQLGTQPSESHSNGTQSNLTKSYSSQTDALNSSSSAADNQTVSQPPSVAQVATHNSHKTTKNASAKRKQNESSNNVSASGSTKAKSQDSTPSTKKSASNSQSVQSVSGGTVTPIANGQVPDTTIRSNVVQFGNRPQTTGFAGSLRSTWGSNINLPKTIPKNRLLAVSLQSGVLWSIIPPTQIQQNGQLGSSHGLTTLMYTPFPSNGTASLTTGALRIGQIMPSTTPNNQTFGIKWFNGSSLPSNTKSGAVNQSGTRGNASNKTSTTTKRHTNVYLASLYSDGSGGVIVADALAPSGSQTRIVYQFNEATRSVKQLVELPNDGQRYSWLGVAPSHIYWGIRKVDSANPSTYTQRQYMYSIPSDEKKQISLGTWTSTVYVNGEHLIFQVGNTTSWKQFTPANSTHSANKSK